MDRDRLDLRHVGGLFAVVVLALGAVDLVRDERVGAADVVLNVVAAAVVTLAALFPTFRLGRRAPGEGFAVPAIAATALAGVLVAAAVLV